MAHDESKGNGIDTDRYDIERRVNLLTQSVSDAHKVLSRLNSDLGSIMPDPEADSPGNKIKHWAVANLTWILTMLAGGGYAYVQWRESQVEDRITAEQFEIKVDSKFESFGKKFDDLEKKKIIPLENDIKEIKAFEVLQYEEQRKMLLEAIPKSRRDEYKKESPEIKEAKKALLAP